MVYIIEKSGVGFLIPQNSYSFLLLLSRTEFLQRTTPNSKVVWQDAQLKPVELLYISAKESQIADQFLNYLPIYHRAVSLSVILKIRVI